MNSINFIESREITSCSQLREIFRDGCCVMIDSRIYMSISSILEIGFMCHLIHVHNQSVGVPESHGLDDVETEEFNRIHDMAYKINFQNFTNNITYGNKNKR